MGSREYAYSVAVGPTAAQIEAAVEAFDDPAGAWAWTYESDLVPDFPTRLIFEGPDALAFAQRALPHLRSVFGVEVLDDHDLAMRYDRDYRAAVLDRKRAG